MADRVVFVTLTRDGYTHVHPDRVHVCKFMGDQVVWMSDYSFTITFQGKGPFKRPGFAGGKGKPAQSGPPVRVGGRPFKYTIQIKGAKPDDPHVGTDP
jgi:hypothetical protein